MATANKFNEIGRMMQAEISKMGASIPKATWDVGEWLKRRIKARTRQGIDQDGKPFAPYSPKYSRKKRANRVTLVGSSLLRHHGGQPMLDQIKTGSEGGGNARFNPKARRFIPVKGSGGMFLAFKETGVFLTLEGTQAAGRAKGHQTGKSWSPNINLPRRAFMGLDRASHGAFEQAFMSKVYKSKSTSESIDIFLNFGGTGSIK